MYRYLVLPLSVAAALTVSTAQAASPLSAEQLMDMPLEKLMNVEVTSASKYTQKASEAPSAVEVITAEDIRTFGYRTLGQALNGLHGLFTTSDRYYNYLGVRGFLRTGDYNSRVLIMVDGRRMNDNIYDETDTGQMFMLDMDLVDHIEYIPGPGSSIYGANALLGVINVITKKGSDINGLQFKGSGGTFRTNETRATYGKTYNNGLDVVMSASRYYSLGPSDLFFPEFNSPATNNGDAHDLDGERAQHYFAKIHYKEFTFESGFATRFKQDPTAAFGTLFNDPGFYTSDTNQYAELKYNKDLSAKTQIELEAFDQWYYYHSGLPYDANLGVPPIARVVNNDAVYGNWWGGEAKLVTSRWEGHKIVTGVEYQFDQRQRVYNYDVSPYVLYQDHNRTGSRIGVYAQDDIRLRKNLILSAGLRFDQTHMLEKSQINPRLGLIWNPMPTTTFKLLYGSAFRAPNIYERDINTVGSVANPDNKEERVKTYEAVGEWQPGTGLKLTGSLFYNNLSQVLQVDPVTAQFMNTGKFVSYGFDIGAEKRWESGQRLKASLDHTLLYDETGTDMWAEGSPKNVARIQYSQPLFDDKTTLGAENVFVSRRKTLQGTMAAAYSLFNVNIDSRNFLPGAEASFGIYNLFGTHAQMVGGTGPDDFVEKVIPMNGRSILLSFQITF
ncbi:MAG TPA: TonB-dependent receptor [Patescibacteria group bacterium]|nr:TonB-dependent receptor [Patescibacteria group bacterium]